MTPATARVRLVDEPDGPGRTTVTMVASVAARLGILHLISGADTIGALTASLAALGREVARSADGARIRQALEAGRAGGNGNLLWSTLRIGEWASVFPPGPILDHLRNDLALLLADDLEAALELPPLPTEATGMAGMQTPETVTFADFVLGMWAFSGEVVRAVEALAAPALPPAGVVASPGAAAGPEGSLLR
jgi:hypothetical protein